MSADLSLSLAQQLTKTFGRKVGLVVFVLLAIYWLPQLVVSLLS